MIKAQQGKQKNLHLIKGRWWALDPVKSPMFFFEKSKPLIPPVLSDGDLNRLGFDCVDSLARGDLLFAFHPQLLKLCSTKQVRNTDAGCSLFYGCPQHLQSSLTNTVLQISAFAQNL